MKTFRISEWIGFADICSREGPAAFARFFDTEAPAARWVRSNVKPARRVAFLGHIVFGVEGGLVANRMRWPLADELHRQCDVECSGPDCPDATEILDLMRADLPLLNEARARRVQAPRGWVRQESQRAAQSNPTNIRERD